MTLSSGQVADLFNKSEPEINRLVRNRRLTDLPPIVAGRRQWGLESVLQAARLLGVPEERVRARFDGLMMASSAVVHPEGP